ncbi:MAG: hypothetical protein ABJG41_14860 [Cyclobacteriaceae bacterium]
MKTFQNTSILTALICLIWALTLGNVHAQGLIEFNIIKDLSASSNSADAYQSELLLKKVMTDLDLRNFDGEVILRTASLGHHKIPVVQSVRLPSSDWMTPASEKRRNLSTFLAVAKRNIEALGKMPADQDETQSFRTLSYLGNQRSKDAKSITYCFTDAVECSDLANFKAIAAADPKKLMEQYDQITRQLLSDTQLPSLDGCKYIFITPGRTDLHLFSIRYFTKLLESFGAEVEVHTSLNF